MKEGYWPPKGAAETYQLMMILCICLFFPVYMIPSIMFLRLSLSLSSVGLFACFWAPSPKPSCAPPTPTTSPYITVLTTSCCYFSVQTPPLAKSSYLTHHTESPRNAHLICLPDIILGWWKKKAEDHNLFNSCASHKLSSLSVPIQNDGTSIPRLP